MCTLKRRSLIKTLIICGTNLFVLLSCATLVAAEAAATRTNSSDTETIRVKPERLWLPSSAQHLRPYLQLAVEQALENEDCLEVLYARLNEYRTVYDEPTFSVLCKKDYKTTFNRIYQVSELDQYYDSRVAESEAAASNAVELSDDIRALRESLLTPTDAIVSNALPAAVQQAIPAETPTAAQGQNRPAREEDPNDLSLDLSLDLDEYRQ